MLNWERVIFLLSKNLYSQCVVVKSNSFVRFLEEINDPKKPFRNELTFRDLKVFMS